jgi:hypothetical protein
MADQVPTVLGFKRTKSELPGVGCHEFLPRQIGVVG